MGQYFKFLCSYLPLWLNSIEPWDLNPYFRSLLSPIQMVQDLVLKYFFFFFFFLFFFHAALSRLAGSSKGWGCAAFVCRWAHQAKPVPLHLSGVSGTGWAWQLCSAQSPGDQRSPWQWNESKICLGSLLWGPGSSSANPRHVWSVTQARTRTGSGPKCSSWGKAQQSSFSNKPASLHGCSTSELTSNITNQTSAEAVSALRSLTPTWLCRASALMWQRVTICYVHHSHTPH